MKYPTKKARLDPGGTLTGLMEIVIDVERRPQRDGQFCAPTPFPGQRWDLYYWNRSVRIELRQRYMEEAS